MTETPQPQHIEGEVILEPGDAGYTDPNQKPPEQPSVGGGDTGTPEQPHTEGGYTDPNEPPPTEPRVGSVPEEAGAVGEDLTHTRDPHESDASFAARTRGVVVHSQSPTDVVPNTPQTTMGVRMQVEGSDPPVYTAVPAEVVNAAAEPEEEEPEEGEQPAGVTPSAAYVGENQIGETTTGEPGTGKTEITTDQGEPLNPTQTEGVPADPHTGEGVPAA